MIGLSSYMQIAIETKQDWAIVEKIDIERRKLDKIRQLLLFGKDLGIIAKATSERL